MPPYDSQPKIKAVLFDMGNTLVDSRNPSETIQIILRDREIEVPLPEIREVLKATHDEIDYHEIKEDGLPSAEEHYIRWNSNVVRALGIDDPGDVLAREIYERWFDVLHLYLLPNALETVNSLKARGIKVGIITNGFREEVDQVFEGLELQARDFDIVVGCNTTGLPKPDPCPFDYAVRKLGLLPEEIIFVGDSYEKDYLGSKNAGMFSVLYLPGGEPPVQAGPDVKFIRDLKEITDLI